MTKGMTNLRRRRRQDHLDLSTAVERSRFQPEARQARPKAPATSLYPDAAPEVWPGANPPQRRAAALAVGLPGWPARAWGSRRRLTIRPGGIGIPGVRWTPRGGGQTPPPLMPPRSPPPGSKEVPHQPHPVTATGREAVLLRRGCRHRRRAPAHRSSLNGGSSATQRHVASRRSPSPLLLAWSASWPAQARARTDVTGASGPRRPPRGPLALASRWSCSRRRDQERYRTTNTPTARSVAWCSASDWSAPDGSALLTLGAPSIQTDPDRSCRIVRMIRQGRPVSPLPSVQRDTGRCCSSAGSAGGAIRGDDQAGHGAGLGDHRQVRGLDLDDPGIGPLGHEQLGRRQDHAVNRADQRPGRNVGPGRWPGLLNEGEGRAGPLGGGQDGRLLGGQVVGETGWEQALLDIGVHDSCRGAGDGPQVEDLGGVAAHTGAGRGPEELGDGLALVGEKGVDIDQRF